MPSGMPGAGESTDTKSRGLVSSSPFTSNAVMLCGRAASNSAGVDLTRGMASKREL